MSANRNRKDKWLRIIEGTEDTIKNRPKAWKIEKLKIINQPRCLKSKKKWSAH